MFCTVAQRWRHHGLFRFGLACRRSLSGYVIQMSVLGDSGKHQIDQAIRAVAVIAVLRPPSRYWSDSETFANLPHMVGNSRSLTDTRRQPPRQVSGDSKYNRFNYNSCFGSTILPTVSEEPRRCFLSTLPRKHAIRSTWYREAV